MLYDKYDRQLRLWGADGQRRLAIFFNKFKYLKKSEISKFTCFTIVLFLIL